MTPRLPRPSLPLRPFIAAAVLTLTSIVACPDVEAATRRADIVTIPPGAEVFVSLPGEPEMSLGETPLKGVKVPRKMAFLRYRLSGHHDLVRVLAAGRKSIALSVELTAKPKVGRLRLTGKGLSGAALFVDAKPVGIWPTALVLSPGRHHLRVLKAGYQPWEAHVELGPDEVREVAVEFLAPVAGQASLLVVSHPSGASVSLGGSVVGKTPLNLTLAPASYRVGLDLDGYLPRESDLDLSAGQSAVLDETLVSASAGLGRMKLFVDDAVWGQLKEPGSATLLVDGVRVAGPPVELGDLEPGTHVVELRIPGRSSVRQTVEVKANQITATRLPVGDVLSPDAGRLEVVANAPGATVQLDGGIALPAPAVFEGVRPGVHFVRVEASRHGAWIDEVRVAPNARVNVAANLEPQSTLRVETATGENADVFINDNPNGQTPVQVSLAAGEVSVKVVRHDESFELQTVVLDGQTDVTVRAFETEAMPLSAQPLAVRRAALTLLWGWPYAFEMGLQLGVYRDMEVEVIFRNMFETTNELEARFQYRFLKEGIYAFGFDAGLAGGRGTKDRNAFSFGLRMLHSIVFADTLAVTASIGGLLFSDQLAFTDGNVAAELGLTDGRRDTGLALALGLSFEVGVSENVNFVLTTDAWPVRTGGKEGRLLFNEGLAGSAKNIDLRGALGLSYLF